MFTLLSKQRKDPLKGQSVDNKHSKKRKVSTQAGILIVATLAISTLLSYYTHSKIRLNIDPSSITFSKDTKISDREKKQILKSIISSQGKVDLGSIVDEIAKKSQLDFVSIAAISPSMTIVSARERVAIAKIYIDSDFVLSRSGFVYRSSRHFTGLPLLTGDLEHEIDKSSPRKRNNFNDSIVRDASSLLGLVQSVGKISRIHYDKYAGFSVEFNDSNPPTDFGYPPFRKKVDRLIGILEDLRYKNKSASRIELDYLDKAFIKVNPPS